MRYFLCFTTHETERAVTGDSKASVTWATRLQRSCCTSAQWARSRMSCDRMMSHQSCDWCDLRKDPVTSTLHLKPIFMKSCDLLGNICWNFISMMCILYIYEMYDDIFCVCTIFPGYKYAYKCCSLLRGHIIWVCVCVFFQRPLHWWFQPL